MKNTLFKLVIFIFSLALFPNSKNFAQPFGGGIFAGGNFSQIQGDIFSGYNLPGFYGGGFVNLELQENLKVQFEISYIRKGAGNNFDETNTTYYKVKLDYIDVPILLEYNVYKKFWVHAGLAYGLLFKQTEDLDGAGDLTPIPLFHNYDFSGLAGFDYYFFKKFAITSRFGYSILPIREHPGNQTYFLNRGQYNNCVSLSLRYHIL